MGVKMTTHEYGGSTAVEPVKRIEPDTIAKIARAVSSSMRPEELIDTLLEIAVEHAGADRALLIRSEGATFRLEAEAITLHSKNEKLPRHAAVPPQVAPLTILRYVVKTENTVLIDDTSRAHQFSGDKYFVGRHCHSLICLPLLRNGEVIGVLYLENSEVSEVFKRIRKEVMEILVAHQALSLENALLHAESRRSTDVLRGLIDTVPALAWVCSSDGRSVSVNQRLLEYIQPAGRELASFDWVAATHPEDHAKLNAFRHSLLASGETGEEEIRLRRFDGEYRWYRIRLSPHHDNSGRISKWFGVGVDVDDRKRIAQNLRVTEVWLAEAQEASHCGSWAIEVRTRDARWSHEMFRLLGYDPANTAPTLENFLVRVHPDDRTRMEQIVQLEVSGAEIAFSHDYRSLWPDGTIKHLHSTAHSVTNGFGEVLEVLGTCRDVTEQRKSEEVIRDSERNLRKVIQTIPAFVWCSSADGKFEHVNERWWSYVGVGPHDEVKPNWLSHRHPEDTQRVRQEWLQSVATGRRFEAEFRHQDRDGVYRWFKMIGEPLHDSAGSVLRWYGLLVDVEDRKNAEQNLQMIQARLSRAAQLATAGELAASIAHEVSQPLSAIFSNAEASMQWLEERTLNLANARRDVGRIVRCARDAAEVVDRVRALFKRSTPAKSPVHMDHLLAEVLLLLQNELVRRKISVDSYVDEALPPVWMDRVQVQQVLVNLIINAIDAIEMASEGLRIISICSKRGLDGTVLVEVRDYGIGLQDPDKPFDSFFTTKEKGLGWVCPLAVPLLKRMKANCGALIQKAPGRPFV